MQRIEFNRIVENYKKEQKPKNGSQRFRLQKSDKKGDKNSPI